MANEKIINEIMLSDVMPGMILSIEKLIESCEIFHTPPTHSKIDSAKRSLGMMASITILSAQCSEILLNYKIESEGNRYIKTHDLYRLYNILSEESKSDIELEFTRLSNNGVILPINIGPKSAKEIFQRSKGALLDSRYIPCPGLYNDESLLHITAIYPQDMYKAAKSIFNSIDLFRT